MIHIFPNSRGLEKTPENKTMMAYIVEDQNVGNLGRDIVFFASKLHPQVETRRMDWMYARNSILQYRGLGVGSDPPVELSDSTRKIESFIDLK